MKMSAGVILLLMGCSSWAVAEEGQFTPPKADCTGLFGSFLGSGWSKARVIDRISGVDHSWSLTIKGVHVIFRVSNQYVENGVPYLWIEQLSPSGDTSATLLQTTFDFIPKSSEFESPVFHPVTSRFEFRENHKVETEAKTMVFVEADQVMSFIERGELYRIESNGSETAVTELPTDLLYSRFQVMAYVNKTAPTFNTVDPFTIEYRLTNGVYLFRAKEMSEESRARWTDTFDTDYRGRVISYQPARLKEVSVLGLPEGGNDTQKPLPLKPFRME